MVTTRRLSRQRSGKNDRRTSASAFAQLIAVSAIARIKQITPNADLAFLSLDQADLESARAAAEPASKEARVDALVNNAGVMMTPLMRTRQGFELQLGVNHRGCFALTSLLLSKLAETKGSRVVITASLAHQSAKGIDWSDLGAEKSCDRFQRYTASKLGNGLGLAPLARERRSISDRRIDDAVTNDAFAASRSGSSASFAVSRSPTRLLPDRRTAEGPSPTEYRRRIGPLPSP
jgi:NAD(P)-dependent dehydrogenase (short-subunit alcohol dehydrogenase family)